MFDGATTFQQDLRTWPVCLATNFVNFGSTANIQYPPFGVACATCAANPTLLNLDANATTCANTAAGAPCLLKCKSGFFPFAPNGSPTCYDGDFARPWHLRGAQCVGMLVHQHKAVRDSLSTYLSCALLPQRVCPLYSDLACWVI